MSYSDRFPDGLPILAAGVHSAPGEGGCFMEYASLLAGESWSDHPRCTHPVLAQLARLVNDATKPEARQLLAPLIPDVIGLVGPDPRVTPALVLLCLEYADELETQRCLAITRHAARRLAAASAGGLGAYRCRLSDAFYRSTVSAVTMARAVRKIADEDSAPDPTLHDLLCDAIILTGQLLKGAPAPSEARAVVDITGGSARALN